MTETHAPRSIVLWRLSEWQCEYFEAPTPGVRLYMGEQLVRSHAATDTFDALECSNSWRQAVRTPQNSRALELAVVAQHDRRVVNRGGGVAGGKRRSDD
jgi:hypothetical protein